MSSFSFAGFTLRLARNDEADVLLATEWTAADPDHFRDTKAAFWLEQRPGVESYLLQDKFGPVFFFKMQRLSDEEVELHMQFPPNANGNGQGADQRERILRGLVQGFFWIEKVLSTRGVKRVSFESRSPGLVRVCSRHLGFEAAGENRLAKDLKLTANC